MIYVLLNSLKGHLCVFLEMKLFGGILHGVQGVVWGQFSTKFWESFHIS
jgi:hypothetical protein